MKCAVFGYGAIGRELAARLLARGDQVTVAQRSPPDSLPAGVQFVPCDLMQEAGVSGVCVGQEQVFCTAGFPYDSATWERCWPLAMKALIAACESAGARLIFADNLYAYGPQVAPLREDMPPAHFGRKPKVRAETTELLLQAHSAGRVKAVAVRSSDFYGPDAPGSVLSTFGIARLLAGQPALIPYCPDFPHDFTYTGDFADALVTLAGASDDAFGQIWHVPNAPARSLREHLATAARMAGVPLRVRLLPPWLQSTVGLFVPAVRELVEMRFQTDRPYLVDTRKFSQRFGPGFTPFETGLTETVSFYRNKMARARRPGSSR